MPRQYKPDGRYSAPRTYSALRNAKIAETLRQQETRPCGFPGCTASVTRRRSHFRGKNGIAFCRAHYQSGQSYLRWLSKIPEGSRPLYIGLVAQGTPAREAAEQCLR